MQNPQVINLGGEGGRGLLGIVVSDPDQDEEPGGAELADYHPGYRYARFTSPLDNSSHEKAFSADDRRKQ